MDRHTYDYGVIGNCSYTAHIHKNTHVSWMCLPRFDSSFIFGRMLDQEKGGEYSIKPASSNFTTSQYYIENTNVLCTDVRSEEGVYRVTDFAPRFFQTDRYYKPLMLVMYGHAAAMGSELIRAKTSVMVIIRRLPKTMQSCSLIDVCYEWSGIATSMLVVSRLTEGGLAAASPALDASSESSLFLASPAESDTSEMMVSRNLLVAS